MERRWRGRPGTRPRTEQPAVHQGTDAHVTDPLGGTRETAHDVPVSAPPLERGARPVKASLGMLAR